MLPGKQKLNERYQMIVFMSFAILIGTFNSWYCFSMESMEKNNRVVIVTENDSGKTIRLSRGDTLVIKLPAQMGTGYSWQMKTPIKILNAIGNPITEHPDTVQPGGYEIQAFTYQAKLTGSGTLRLSYARPWQKDAPPLKVFTLKILIR